MIFKTPAFLIIIPIFLFIFFLTRRIYPERAILFPTDEVIKSIRGSFKIWLSRKLIYLRAAAIIMVIIALARPQSTGGERIRREGIAIMLTIDCSSTMLAEDLQLGALGLAPLVEGYSETEHLNRLDAVKKVANDFIASRPDDMIGIVAFAAQAYVVCPPTFDRVWLEKSLDRVRVGMIRDATAIGSGILSSLESLKGITAQSKIVVLLTDGINNFGEVPPLVAAKAARTLGIKIYTIGISSRGQTPYPAKDVYGKKTYQNVKIDIDEKTLREIANITGGNYYNVSNLRALKNSYVDIDKLEKVGLEETAYEEHKDIFANFVVWALIMLALEIILSNTYLRKIP